MSVTVTIPTPLRSFTGGRDAVELPGATVGEVIDGLLSAHGGLKRHLVQDDGRLRNFVNLYLNDTDIRHLESVSTPVRQGDVLSIVPSIAGGSPAVETELPKLSHSEVLRYSRHLLLPEVGVEGQRKLKAARVLIIGAGGLGSPLCALPRRGGRRHARHRGLRRRGPHQSPAADPARHRDVGRPKLESARGAAHRPQSERATWSRTRPASPRRTRSTSSAEYDIVVDGTDNFPTRYLVNDACVLLGKPQRVRQHLPVRRARPRSSIRRTARATAACTPEPPPPGPGAELRRRRRARRAARHHRQHPGARGDQAGSSASGDSLVGRLLLFDALELRFRELKLRKDPDCPICGDSPHDPRADRLRGLLRHRRGAGVSGAGGDRRRSCARNRTSRATSSS